MLTTQSPRYSTNKFTSQWGVDTSIQAQQLSGSSAAPTTRPFSSSQTPQLHDLGFLVLAASVPLPMPFPLLEGTLPYLENTFENSHSFWSLSLAQALSCPN